MKHIIIVNKLTISKLTISKLNVNVLNINKRAIFTLFSIISLFAITSVFAAEESKSSEHARKSPIDFAIIENGFVKKATHYHLINGEWTNADTPAANWHKPKAFFYAYQKPAKNNEFAQNKFLGQIEVETFDTPTIEFLNTLIDPHAKLPEIRIAIIKHCLKHGRYVHFCDANGEHVDTSYPYSGSLNIKSEKENTQLIKPHSLLANLHRVQESKPPFWLSGLLGIAGDSLEEHVYDR